MDLERKEWEQQWEQQENAGQQEGEIETEFERLAWFREENRKKTMLK